MLPIFAVGIAIDFFAHVGIVIVGIIFVGICRFAVGTAINFAGVGIFVVIFIVIGIAVGFRVGTAVVCIVVRSRYFFPVPVLLPLRW